ncbi:preprotein translocase subunit YajC [Hazenella coriacea]|uniref:Preprotein translocase subunit YajC n=1 Tax=Hazenella coriacea TaxID=1179467 RepID=A0A4R3L8U3_9BACL|nr:preprotein translocase subunit YajC [Hazenella coriacea]TCS96461.1 preprotein translocase subunit YajC [Hazenella coriacea]
MPQQYTSLIMIAFVFIAFYFFLMRPQQKQQKQRAQMLSALKKGDRVITIGGIHGSIVDLTEEKVTLKVSDNTRLVFERSAINAVTNAEETTTVNTESKKEEKEVSEEK